MEFKTIKVNDFFSYEKTIIPKDVQRKYEWDSSIVDNFCVSLITVSKMFYDNPRDSDPLMDWGTIIRYKLDKKEFEKYDYTGYSCLKMDEGGQRIRTFSIMFKVLYDIIKTHNNFYNDKEIVKGYIICKLEKTISDINTNLVEELNTDEFNSIMQNTSHDNGNSAMYVAVKTMMSRFNDLLSKDMDAFETVCRFLCDIACVHSIVYDVTSENVRRIKYNLCNNLNQPQDILHRTVSTLSQMAAEEDMFKFKLIFETTFEKYKQIILDSKNSKKWGNAENKRLRTIFTVYFYIKLIQQLGKIPKHNGSNINDLAIELHSIKNYDSTFFYDFFNEFSLFYNLRTKKVEWKALKTKENCIFSVLVASLVDVLSPSTKPRYSASAYYFKILTECFVIKNDCQIECVKEHINKNLLIKLLSNLLIYKICIDSATTNSKNNDERGVFQPLLKNKTNFCNESILNEHITKTNDILQNACFSSVSYGMFTSKGFGYKSKGVTFALAICSSNDKQEIHETFYEIASRFFNSPYKYDKDHVLTYKNEKKSKDDRLCNLRLRDKNKNRSENNLNPYERYIDVDDYSFPEHLRGQIFTKDNLEERDAYMNSKIKRFIDNLHSLNTVNKLSA